jgi:hypothetical protein
MLQQKKVSWIQLGKVLLALVPAMTIYAIVATRGLVAVCRATSSYGELPCDVSYVASVVIAILTVRIIHRHFVSGRRSDSSDDSGG